MWAPAQDDGRSARDCFAAAITEPVFPVALDNIARAEPQCRLRRQSGDRLITVRAECRTLAQPSGIG